MTTLTMPGAGTAGTPVKRRSWLGDPGWARPALAVLLLATAVLYLWNLSASGWGNEFYAASAQAGSQSWKAWLFASLDAGNGITVDKPPAAMWVMGLSARIFGVNSWAILAPQALMGVGSVALLHASVRRWSGPVAGLLAGALLAVTPVAVLMFRFDNPDALLVLLMTAAAYATVRACETASGKWLALAGVFLGFGFLTKMLQAFLVLPGFALAYLLFAPTGWARRIRHLLIGAGALIVSGGWLVLLVSLWPASSRPYIAGSTNNSLWQLAIGYNGLGRIFGGEGNGGGGGPGGGGPGGGGGGGSMFGGSPGLGRMFGDSFGLEISWLLPAALVALVALLAIGDRRARAAATIWGAWVVVTGLTFSFMSGTVHPYYTIALAPGIAALVAIGARTLWRLRASVPARAGLAAMLMVTGVWDFVLLGRVDWAPALRWIVLAGGVLAGLAFLVPVAALRRLGTIAALAGVVTAGAATAAWGVSTAAVAHTGSTPVSGPSGVSTGGGFGGRGGFPGAGGDGGGGRDGGGFGEGGFRGGRDGAGSPGGGGFPGGTQNGGADQSGTAQGGTAQGGTPSGGLPAGGGTAEGGGLPAGGGAEGGGLAAGGGAPGGGGFGGGTADADVVALLKAGGSRWAAATNGSMQAAPLQLASGRPVLAIGGFTGSDPSPTLAEFQQYVAGGQIHYYIAGGGGRGGFGGGSQIQQWVQDNYTATTVGSSTVYDLTQKKS